jgi:hypothetical protein
MKVWETVLYAFLKTQDLSTLQYLPHIKVAIFGYEVRLKFRINMGGSI